MVARVENSVLLEQLQTGAANVRLPDGTTRVATPDDLPWIIEARIDHIGRWAKQIQLMNVGDGGPGGFAGYPLLARLAEILTDDITFSDLATLERNLAALYPHLDCPYKSVDEAALLQPSSA